jgi:hypothetical protein
MTVRQFNGTSDELVTGIGAASGMVYGTVATLLKFSTVTGFRDWTMLHDSGGAYAWSPNGLTNFSTLQMDNHGANSNSGINPGITAWKLVVVRKATGTATPRFSVYDYTSGAWTHAAGASTLADSSSPPGSGGQIRFTYQGTADFFGGKIAARALWANSLPWTADSAGDLAIEASGLNVSAYYWKQKNPTVFHLFNQASIATSVVDLSTGGTGNQSSIIGTTAVTGDDPAGFNFSLTLTPPILELGMDEASGALLDTSGNGRDVTLTGNNTRTAAGSGYTYGGTTPNSKGLVQTAADTFVAFNGAMTPFNTTSRTVMFWAKQPGINPSWVMEYYDAANDTGVFGWLLLSSVFRFRAKDTSFTVYERNLTSAPTVFHHYCATHDGTNLKVYVDGAKVGADVSMPAAVRNADALRIYDAAGSTPVLDDVRIFNTALTSSEINTWMTTPVGTPAAGTKVYFSNGSQSSGIYEQTAGGLVQRNSIIIK